MAPATLSLSSPIQRDLRQRIERILGGAGRAEDLSTLFLSQRDKPYARESVTEVGDFIAHRDIRIRGPAWARCRDVFLGMRTFVAANEAGYKVPFEDAVVGARARLRLMPDPVIEGVMGFGRPVAESMLGRIITKKFGSKNRLNTKELRLISYLVNQNNHVPPIFTPELLISDLTDTLMSARLMLVEEQEFLVNRKDFVCLFVASKMHGSELTLSEGFSAHLTIGGDPELRVWAETPMSFGDIGVPTVGFSIFDTQLLSADYCVPELAAAEQGWSEPVEVNAQGLLDFIRL